MSAAHATCGRGCGRTSAAIGSGRPSRRRSARPSGSSGACSAPSSRPRSRSCASSASCGRRGTRASRARSATSGCARAAIRSSRAETRPVTVCYKARSARGGRRSSPRGRLKPEELERPAAALPRLRAGSSALAEARRFEDAARLRDRIAAVERVCRELDRLERLRTIECCVLVPARRPGLRHCGVRRRRPGRRRADASAGRRRGARDRSRSRRVPQSAL